MHGYPDRVYDDTYLKHRVRIRVPRLMPICDECNFFMCMNVSMYKVIFFKSGLPITSIWVLHYSIYIDPIELYNRKLCGIYCLYNNGSMYRVYVSYRGSIILKCQKNIEN